MTYLELCKELRRRCGIQGDGPSSVASQVGVLATVVAEVQNAYREI